MDVGVASKKGEWFFSWKTPVIFTAFILLLALISAVNVINIDSPFSNNAKINSNSSLNNFNSNFKTATGDADENIFRNSNNFDIMKLATAKDITYETITKEEYMKKNNISEKELQALCLSCDNRNYEYGDRSAYCSCYDDKNGINGNDWQKCKDYMRKSTSYNYDDGPLKSATDYCKDGNILREQYIDCYNVDEIFYTEKNCNDYDDYSDDTYYCTSTAVKRERYFHDFSCGSGACKETSKKETEIVSQPGDNDYCGRRKAYTDQGAIGCTLCGRGDYDCDYNSECSSGLSCMGPIGGATDGCCYSNEEWDSTNKKCLTQCTNNCSDRDSRCSGDSLQLCEVNDEGCTEWINPISCGADSCGAWGDYCKSDDVYTSRTCYDKGCSNGACFSKSSTEDKLKQDCGDSGYSGSNYCYDSDVYRDYLNKGCSGSSCFSNPEKKKQTECGTLGCENGVCKTVCAPGQKRCSGNNLETCKSDGSGWTATQYCGTNSFCLSASCSSCSSGKSNCDKDSSNGCEKNILTDNNNCGGCGVVCSSGNSCKNGVCVNNYSLSLISSFAPLNAILNQKFEIKCNYGIALQCISAIHGGAVCSYKKFEGTTAVFECTALNTGVKENYCNIFYDSSSPYCLNPRKDKINSTLVGQSKCFSASDCGTDGWIGYNFCSNNDLYQSWRTYKCNNPGTANGYCSNSDSNKLKQDCGNSGYTGSNYCYDSDVYRDYLNKGCSGSSCFSNPEKKKQTECGTLGCENGVCKSPQDFIISGLSPSSYQITTLLMGSKYYIDRNFVIKSLPSVLQGSKAIKTKNDFLSQTTFSVNKNVRVYLAWDMREKTPSGWTLTSDKIYVSDKDASNKGGYLHLLYKDFNSGSVSVPKKNSKSNYIIFVAAKSADSELKISNLNPSTYKLTSLNKGSQYYTDRTFVIQSDLPSVLNNHLAIKTSMDNRQETKFSINKNVRVYLAWDMREKTPSGWTLTSDKIYVSDKDASNKGGYLHLLYKDFNAGNVVIPKKVNKSNYIIFAVKR